MKFITIRDFRSKSAKIQRDLPREREMVLTSNGKPIAILSAISEDTLEDSISTIRRARAINAVTAIQTKSFESGKSRMSLKEVNKEIAAVRKRRKAR